MPEIIIYRTMFSHKNSINAASGTYYRNMYIHNHNFHPEVSSLMEYFKRNNTIRLFQYNVYDSLDQESWATFFIDDKDFKKIKLLEPGLLDSKFIKITEGVEHE